MSSNIPPPPPPPIDAKAFTVSAIDATEMKEYEAEMDRVKSETSAKSRDKIMAQMMKPPPPAVIRDQIKQKEKIIHDAEEVEKRKILGKVQLYVERFPMLLNKIPKINLSKLSLPEAQEILIQIREIMDSVNSVRTIVGYLDMGFAFTEGVMSDPKFVSYVPQPLRCNLTGLSKLFREGNFPELDPIIAELDIEYPWIGRRPLIWRLVGALAGIAQKVHIANTYPELAKKMFDMEQRRPMEPPEEPVE